MTFFCVFVKIILVYFLTAPYGHCAVLSLVRKLSMSVSKKAKITMVSVLLCIGTVGACAGIVLSRGVIEKGDTAAAAVSVSEPAAESVADESSTESAENADAPKEEKIEKQSFKLTSFKKATVDSYDMSIHKAAASAEKKAQDPNDFTVEFPEDTEEYYDVHNEPLNFTETRSIAGEYYTVNDIISGSVVTMNAHDMICSMVYSEISDAWGDEAIKAQAVAAYSFLRFCATHGIRPDVGLKTNYTSKIESCVSSVEGQVVVYQGEIINAVYSASTAGWSTASKNIWGGDYHYLQRVKSVYDSKDPNWGLEKTYTKDQVKAILEKRVGFTLSDNVMEWFTIARAFSGKYISTITITGNAGQTANIPGEAMCDLFDLKSIAMDITFKDGSFTFKTYGWGHGTGMSQWGACLYADAGWTYDQILTHYYIDTTLALSSFYSQPAPQQTDDNNDTNTQSSQDDTSGAAADGTQQAQTEAQADAADGQDTAADNGGAQTEASQLLS